MAAAEARALLDQLMGGDRNAALPRGAALPRSKRARDNGESSSLLLPGKRHKSCFDNDICPLYCAWGVVVYELFVNTKSDNTVCLDRKLITGASPLASNELGKLAATELLKGVS